MLAFFSSPSSNPPFPKGAFRTVPRAEAAQATVLMMDVDNGTNRTTSRAGDPTTKETNMINDQPVVSSSSSGISDGPQPHLHAKTFLAVFAVCMIYFAQLLSLVGSGAQGQTIAAHFNGTKDVVWFSTPVTILTVVLGPIVSQAADYWGRKWFLVILTLFGAAGSIIVATATSMNMAIGGFCVIGISFGVQPLLHTVSSEVLPRKWRGYGQAADMTSNALGTVFGLLVGGALNKTNDPTKSGFRTYFYITMAWYLAAAMLCFLVYNPPETQKQKELCGQNMEKLKKLDWVGYFFLAAGLVLFCIALSLSKNPYPWTDARVSATFAVGMVMTVCLVGHQAFIKKDGMFHHELFTTNRNFSIALFCVFAEGVAFFAVNVYFAFQVAVLYETDAVVVGTCYSIQALCSIVGAALTGLYCAYARRLRVLTVLAFLIFVAFFAAMANTSRTTSNQVWGYPVLSGFALGMTLTTLVTVAQLCTPPELIAIASGLIISIRSVGGTIGIAIYDALFNDALAKMGDNIAAAVLPQGLPAKELPHLIAALDAHNQTALRAIPGVSPGIIKAGAVALLDTYVTGFRHVWIAASCFVGLAAVVAAFLFDPRKEFNMHVDAPVEKEEDMYNF